MSAMSRLLLFTVIFFCIASHGKQITIYNKTPRDLYIATYYLGLKSPFKEQPHAKRSSNIKLLAANETSSMEQPVRKIGSDRYLAFVEDKKLLKPELTKEELEQHRAKNIECLQAAICYISEKEGEFCGCTALEWNKRDQSKLNLEHEQAQILKQLTAVHNNPYKDTVAMVRYASGNEISSGEKEYLGKRKPIVQNALENLLDKKITKIPTIALVVNGGGYRGMLYAIGALKGAHDSGILDAITYMVGTSGASWALGGWLTSNQPITAYHDWLIEHVNKGLANITDADVAMIGNSLMIKYFYAQPLDMVDLYGPLLANELFSQQGMHKQEQTLSGQIKRIQDCSVPFPLYLAVDAQSNPKQTYWYEFNPYEIGASWLSLYVPSWAFGRPFKNGLSTNSAPEQNFGVLMGTFGLATDLDLQQLINDVPIKNKINSVFVKNIVDRIMQEHSAATSSNFFNFTYDMTVSTMRANRIIKLADAKANIPYTLIAGQRMGRTADIIIIVDASSDITKQLRMLQEQASSIKNVKIPPIDYKKISSAAVHVFKSQQDPRAPILIYLPRVVDQAVFHDPAKAELAQQFADLADFDIEACIQDGPCSSTNFAYSPDQAQDLTRLGQLNMRLAYDAIMQAIEQKVR
jgi:hypothetical protein